MDDKHFPEEALKLLQKELSIYVNPLSQAAATIVDQGISNYPIMVFSQAPVEMGIPLIPTEETGGKWVVRASTLEEFSTKGIVTKEKVGDFISNLKERDDQLCVFVLNELGATFVFIPRK